MSVASWASKLKTLLTVQLDSDSSGSVSPPTSVDVSSDEDTFSSQNKDLEFKAIFNRDINVTPELQAQVRFPRLPSKRSLR